MSGVSKKKTTKTIDIKKTRKNNIMDKRCLDTSFCLSLGIKTKYIYDYFDQFKNFKLMVHSKDIGDKSNNGNVELLTFAKNKHVSYAILKYPIKESSDNLFYEGYVGQFINKRIVNYFPSFVQTFGVGKFINDETIKFQEIKLVNNEIINIGKSCLDVLSNCLLVQYIKNASTLQLLFESILQYNDERTRQSIIYEIFNYLFQIYSSLDALKNQFTHYDLHTSNILIYHPFPDGKHITMRYHYTDGVVEFHTSGISKIIDYGRSFFYASKNVNSTKIYDVVCKEAQCGKNCGSKYGYGWTTFTNNLYITSSKRNISHDLRLIQELKLEFNVTKIMTKHNSITSRITNGTNTADSALQELFDKLIYGAESDKMEYDHFGTREITVDTYPTNISNVSDAYKFLKNIILSSEFKEINTEKYTNSIQMGVLDVWIHEKKPMVYTAL